MNDFTRKNPLLSLCGLNCGLCTMQICGHCPGCGQGNKPCKAARCGMKHGVEYCFECAEYEDGYETVCAKLSDSRVPISAVGDIELCHYGCTKLRMTVMPEAE